MKVSYFHVAADVPKGSLPDAAVVIDVLRATTTIAFALQNGAESVQVFENLDELRETAGKWPESSRLMLGERGGKRVEGFDLGNSPLAVVPGQVAGKRLFMSTTNGTRSLHRVRDVQKLYTMSLPNRKAVVERLLNEWFAEIWIVGSGWEGAYSLEDSLAAGALISMLMKNSSRKVDVINDELSSAFALWEKWKDDVEGCLRESTHGKRLLSIGDHDEDLKCCATLDQLMVVPTQSSPGILSAA
ncbi:2-phosphosulfolactate phosphatase family protein [Prochlorococcus sp. MIT 1341]|uniref:2-phosphosulfolactate phosphatase family protein n=1 Tax=Prochlorococcus sp. MIT 1341 TaxID=3096221 RepID=UPI002A74DE97|nr:2-phosphosulfolactate phosphatase family protein [Prochlorococcus sp. MIT 1341]